MGDEIDGKRLRDMGLTCPKLKSLESNERRDAEKALKDAQTMRSYGFMEGAILQEKVGKVQEEYANKLKTVRDKVCALK